MTIQETGAKTVSDEEGAFSFSDLQPGVYRLVAESGSLASPETRVTVGLGAPVSVSLVLQTRIATPTPRPRIG